MATTTATVVITAAAKLLQRLGFGSASPTTEMLDDGLVYLQDMINNANLSSNMWIGAASSTFTPVAATQSYTIGPAMTIAIARPPKILAASMLNNGLENPMRVLQDVREWTDILDRKSQSRMERALFYDRGNPTGNIYISPIPLAAGTAGTITIWYPQTQVNFADKTTAIEILPGYARWLRMGLAVEFASTYSANIPQSVGNAYQQALDAIATLNSEMFAPGGPLPPLPKETSA